MFNYCKDELVKSASWLEEYIEGRFVRIKIHGNFAIPQISDEERIRVFGELLPMMEFAAKESRSAVIGGDVDSFKTSIELWRFCQDGICNNNIVVAYRSQKKDLAIQFKKEYLALETRLQEQYLPRLNSFVQTCTETQVYLF